MAKSKEDILALIKLQKDKHSSFTDGVGGTRMAKLIQIATYFKENNFPVSSITDKLKFSLLPYIFQECNYDNDDLADPKHTHVKELLDLDFYIAFDGREREQVTRSEVQNYIRLALKIK